MYEGGHGVKESRGRMDVAGDLLIVDHLNEELKRDNWR